MLYSVYETETFSNLYASMEKEEQKWIDKMKAQIKENPYVGKPLRFEWFREKKFGDKRLYYLVYQNIAGCFLCPSALKKTSTRL